MIWIGLDWILHLHVVFKVHSLRSNLVPAEFPNFPTFHEKMEVYYRYR